MRQKQQDPKRGKSHSFTETITHAPKCNLVFPVEEYGAEVEVAEDGAHQQVSSDLVVAQIRGSAADNSCTATKIKKKRGFVAIREIRKIQKHGRLLVPRYSFKRLVVGVLAELQSHVRKKKHNKRFTKKAVLALQEGGEAYVVKLLEDAQLCAIHAKRETIRLSDMILAQKLQRHRIP